MKRILPIALIVLAGFAYAQYEDYDLSKYRLTDYKRSSLNGRISGYNNYRRENNVSNPSQENIELDNSTNFQISMDYFFEEYTRNYLRILDMDIDLGLNIHDNENWYYTYLRSDIRPRLYINSTYRQYLSTDVFAETDIIANINYRRYNESRDYLTEGMVITRVNEYKDIDLYVPIKFGKGRIERVDDARRAIYVFQALDEAGRINGKISESDIVEFAELICDLRNERTFDGRLRNMKHLEDLDSYLKSKGFVVNADARYFATLNDMWNASSQNARYAGSYIAFALRPGVVIDYTKDIKNDEYDNQRNSVIDLGVEYAKETPINLYWQESIVASFFTGMNDQYRHRTSYNTSTHNQYINMCASIERRLAYYPNTRTNIVFRLGAFIGNGIARLGHEPELILSGTQVIQGLGAIDLNYYITPKLKINAGYQIEYMWTGQNWSSALPLNRTVRNFSSALSPNSSEEHAFYSRFDISIDFSIF